MEESTTRILVNESPELYTQVPHPFSWIVLKTVAAGDWLTTRGTDHAKPGSEKHPYDVYVLTSMITEEELASCQGFNERHENHELLLKARDLGRKLFGTPDSLGYREACKRAKEELPFEAFWEGAIRLLWAWISDDRSAMRRALGWATHWRKLPSVQGEAATSPSKSNTPPPVNTQWYRLRQEPHKISLLCTTWDQKDELFHIRKERIMVRGMAWL